MRCTIFFFNYPPILPIASVSQFVEFIEKVQEKSKSASMVYRGHSKEAYELIPSLFRNRGHLRHEAEMMRRIFASQPDAFKDDFTTLEKLVRFQHFGLPTRLLDVTWNPLVALYFCVKENPDFDGNVILISCSPKQTKYFDSDTVSCLANLAYLKGSERNILRQHLTLSKDKFNKIEQTQRLVSFIKAEKTYFINEVTPADLNRAVLVRPKQSNRRIIAQNGAFIIFGLNQTLSKNKNNSRFDLVKILVEKGSKSRILKQLDRLGFNDESMFPELESAAKYIKKQFENR